MFVTGLHNRTNNKHNRQTKLMISMGLSFGAEICDRGQEIVVEKSLHKRFTVRLGTARCRCKRQKHKDVQRETGEELGRVFVWRCAMRGARTTHTTTKSTTIQSLAVDKSCDDNDDDGDN